MAFVVTRRPYPRSILSLIPLEGAKPAPAVASKRAKKPEVEHPKEDPARSEPYRRLVAALPCANCGIQGYSQAAHPTPTGKGIKEDDRECFPLCTVHKVGRRTVEGCHEQFDQYRLLPAAKMRAAAARWARNTRAAIERAGQWPKRLPKWSPK